MNNTVLFDTLYFPEVFRHDLSAPHTITPSQYTLLYSVHGACAIHSGSTEFLLPAHSLVLVPPLEDSIILKPETVCHLAEIPFFSYSAIVRLFPSLYYIPVPADDALQPHLDALLSAGSCYNSFGADWLALHLQFVLLFMVSSLSPAASPPILPPDPMDDTAMRTVIAYIYDHLADNITFQDLTAAAHCSAKQLYGLFRCHLHSTPMKYIAYIRLSRAKNLLLTTDMTITQIAAACGFQSVHYFSHTFKNDTGISPIAYRQQKSAHSLPDSPSFFPDSSP